MSFVDGTSIYLTRDIGGAIERYDKYKFDKMIYVVSSQQDLHLAQFFKVLELMKFPWAKDLVHINYGLVEGMSTRKGTVVFLEQIINKAKETMHEQMQKNEEKYKAIEDPETTSREIGITGIKLLKGAFHSHFPHLFSNNGFHSGSIITHSIGSGCSPSRAIQDLTSNTHTSVWHPSDVKTHTCSLFHPHPK